MSLAQLRAAIQIYVTDNAETVLLYLAPTKEQAMDMLAEQFNAPDFRATKRLTAFYELAHEPRAKGIASRLMRRACILGELERACWLQMAYSLSTSDVRICENFIFLQACRQGRLDIAKWLVDAFGAEVGRQLREGDTRYIDPITWPDVAEIADRCYNYLVVRNLPNDGALAVCLSCLSGKLDLVRWLFEVYPVAKLGALLGVSALQSACESGDLKVAQVVYREFKLTATDFVDDNEPILSYATADGHLSIAKWLASTLQLTPENVKESNHITLRKVGAGGHIVVAKWLIETFNLTEGDVYNSGVFIAACKNGQLAFAQWTATTYREVASDSALKAFDASLIGGHADVARWVFTEFDLHRYGLICHPISK